MHAHASKSKSSCSCQKKQNLFKKDSRQNSSAVVAEQTAEQEMSAESALGEWGAIGANVMRSLETGEYQPEPPWGEIGLQAKLTIGQPGDKYEQEADRVARQVVQQINSPQSESVGSEEERSPQLQLQSKAETGKIQREEIEEEEEEEELQMKPLVQFKAYGSGMTASKNLETSINEAKNKGQPLADKIRDPMEQAFRTDFSGVKVHLDNRSDKLNRSLQARAFTTGQDIFFRQGEYEPASRRGQELIAHELTHVMQQTAQIQRQHHEEAPSQIIEHIRTHPEAVEQIRNTLQLKPVSSKPQKNSHSLATNIIQGKQSFKLVFYDPQGWFPRQGKFFRNRANLIAREINAVRIPRRCPKDKSKLNLRIGAIGFNSRKNILPDLKRASKCLGKQIDELHIVGHTHEGVKFGKAVSKMAKYLSTQVRIVFHGCSVLSLYPKKLKVLLKELGLEAKIFAHAQSGQAGKPFEFHEITLPEGVEKIKSEPVKNVSEILPETYIRKWVEKLPTDKLYSLYKLVKAEDTKKIMRERIIEKINSWSLRACRRRLEGKSYRKTSVENWEKEGLEKRIEALKNQAK
ncbi:MAG: DUF4157 domain-containing protein [Prochloraceae cyanobacterium]|nr:DUF4157 domain-containing protein [Prochloraceae cyanobacterium]